MRLEIKKCKKKKKKIFYLETLKIAPNHLLHDYPIEFVLM